MLWNLAWPQFVLHGKAAEEKEGEGGREEEREKTPIRKTFSCVLCHSRSSRPSTVMQTLWGFCGSGLARCKNLCWLWVNMALCELCPLLASVTLKICQPQRTHASKQMRSMCVLLVTSLELLWSSDPVRIPNSLPAAVVLVQSVTGGRGPGARHDITLPWKSWVRWSCCVTLVSGPTWIPPSLKQPCKLSSPLSRRGDSLLSASLSTLSDLFSSILSGNTRNPILPSLPFLPIFVFFVCFTLA